MTFWRATRGEGSLSHKGKLGTLGLAASICCSCSNVGNGNDTNDAGGTKDVTSSLSGGPRSGAEPGTASGSESSGEADSGSSSEADSGPGSGDDSASGGEADAGPSSGADLRSSPRSCGPGGAGMTDCGSGSESCCTSPEVTGGTYDRTYANSGGGPTGRADSATVSTFRLDKYEVTVGRFRQFVNAWNGGAGYAPPEGAGKHTHLSGGKGLANLSSDAGDVFEMGWAASDDSAIAPTNANLACESKFGTWTSAAGSQESMPINCVNWYESYAFCIWDGGFLPSEAEWEYAAAGGTRQQEYPWGSIDPGTTGQYAIYGCYYPSGSGNCTGGAAPVGTATLGAGLWGQLDLAGNVNEWNLDSYATYGAPCADCAYLTAASYRVLRGGYFYNHTSYLRPSIRSDDPPNVRSICIGFRCARSAPSTSDPHIDE